jgi:prepilin-type N-terminal cleavage/methylation domain-containing protein
MSTLLLNNLKRTPSKGFTLLEVTIALALLVMALGILLQSQTSAVIMTVDAEKIRIATQLAEEKMSEAQIHLEVEGWTTADIDENGDFSDLGEEEFRGTGNRSDAGDDLDDYYWAYTVRRIEISIPSDLGGMTEDLMGSGYFGDQPNNEDVQNNQMDLGDLGISPDMISDYLSDYIREVRVMVWWGDREPPKVDKEGNLPDNQVELLTHVINPTGVVSTADDPPEVQ